MPTQAADAISRVADSVERLATVSHQLHSDVHGMNRRQRRQSYVLWLLVFAVLLLIFGALVDYNERQDAADSRKNIEQVVQDIERATSPESVQRGQERTAEAVATINATNIAIAECQRQLAPNLAECVAARVTQP